MKLRHLLFGRKAVTNLDNITKGRDITLLINMVCQSYGFSRSHVWMWESNHKEGWVPKNWCFRTGVVEETPESPLDCKEVKPVHSKGNQSWIFIGSTDAEAPILWPPDAKSQLIGKDPDAGKGWRQKEKEVSDDKMVRSHRWVNGHEFEQTPRVGGGQDSLVCFSLWGHKEPDMTELLNGTELSGYVVVLNNLKKNSYSYISNN